MFTIVKTDKRGTYDMSGLGYYLDYLMQEDMPRGYALLLIGLACGIGAIMLYFAFT